jgi:hypothetical protein
MKKYQTKGSVKSVNKYRESGSSPLSEYSPKIKRGSGNLIPAKAKKHPVTGKSLNPTGAIKKYESSKMGMKKMGGMTKSKKK